MNQMQSVGSTRWEDKQLAEFLSRVGSDGGSFPETRLGVAASQRLTNAFFDGASSLMNSEESWAVLPEKTYQYLSLSFAMLSRACCGINANIHRPHAGYPFKWYRLHGPRGCLALCSSVSFGVSHNVFLALPVDIGGCRIRRVISTHGFESGAVEPKACDFEFDVRPPFTKPLRNWLPFHRFPV